MFFNSFLGLNMQNEILLLKDNCCHNVSLYTCLFNYPFCSKQNQNVYKRIMGKKFVFMCVLVFLFTTQNQVPQIIIVLIFFFDFLSNFERAGLL